MIIWQFLLCLRPRQAQKRYTVQFWVQLVVPPLPVPKVAPKIVTFSKQELTI